MVPKPKPKINPVCHNEASSPGLKLQPHWRESKKYVFYSQRAPTGHLLVFCKGNPHKPVLLQDPGWPREVLEGSAQSTQPGPSLPLCPAPLHLYTAGTGTAHSTQDPRLPHLPEHSQRLQRAHLGLLSRKNLYSREADVAQASRMCTFCDLLCFNCQGGVSNDVT